MTAKYPRTRFFRIWSGAIGLATLLALAGCKSGNSDTSTRNSDPLVSGPTRIPPQNVPLPERAGNNGKSDPLLLSPTGKPSDRSGVGYTEDPARFKDTYIPGPGSTPAALASKFKDGEELKIDGNENRVPLQQTGGIQPSKPFEQSSALSPLYSELEKYGCKQGDRSLTQENGQFVCRVAVPMSGGNGAKLNVTGVGRTQEEAVKQALDQVIAERK